MAFFIKLLGARPVRLKVDEGEPLTIGRSPETELCLEDKLVSRRHCQLSATADGVSVRDLGSRNGTRLNGEKVDGEALAHPGDQLKIGSAFILIERDRAHTDSAALPASPAPAAKRLGAPAMPSLPGYELIRELGRGTSGRIYKARSLIDGRDVALKLLPKEVPPNTVKRFLRSARALQRLDHPNIVRIFEVATAAGYHYFTMECLEGRFLSEALAKRPLGARAALSIGVQVARALKLAHRQDVIHRDIAPENILLLPGGLVKLLGFGFAKTGDREADSGSLTNLGELVGVIACSSPEQVQDPRDVDHRTDLYGLGAVLFQAIAGRPPFEGKNHLEIIRKVLSSPVPSLRELVPTTPEAVDEVVTKLLAKQREDRFQTAADVERALDDALLDVCGSERREGGGSHSFGGGFSGLELLEIAQFLELHRKDGRLIVSSPPLEGEVSFRSGAIIAASAGQLDGQVAALTLLKAAEGTFRFRGLRDDEPLPDMGIDLQPSALAIEILRQRDEGSQRFR